MRSTLFAYMNFCKNNDNYVYFFFLNYLCIPYSSFIPNILNIPKYPAKVDTELQLDLMYS